MATRKKTRKRKQKTTSTKGAKASLPKITIGPINKYVKGIIYILLAVFLAMSAFDAAGTIGQFVQNKILMNIIGYGFILIPLLLSFLAYRTLQEIPIRKRDGLGFTLIFISITGLIDIFGSAEGLNAGGTIGKFIGSNLVAGFDIYFSTVLLIGIAAICSFIIFDPKLTVIKNIKESIKEREQEQEATKIQEDKIDEQVEKATQKAATEVPEETPKKGFSIEGITKKKSKKEDDTEISIDAGGVFASSYVTPPLSLLGKSSGKPSTGDIKANANLIQRTLSNFGIAVEMDEISIGPTVTRYAMKPAQGVRLSKIASLQNELALALAAKSIRIEAPIPGRSLVGIEVPNTKKSTIGLGSQLAESDFKDPSKPLLVSLGKGVSGKSHFANIGKMPHALIAGATGAGKSVTIHNIVMSLLYKNGPDMLRFIMIDPKRVEMTLYKKIPHLLTPVITDPKKAVLALKWAVKEMERRYDVLQKNTVRDINSYHKTIVKPAYKDLSPEDIEEQSGELPEKMPYIVVIIDELSDIMSSYPRELEASIVRLAQMSRAVGIHLLLATQRPSVNVITGLIKANVPTRLALKVASQVDSRTILDSRGAEKLLGYGDMLYKGEGSNEPVRIQCPFVSESEVKSVVSFIQKNYKHELDDTIALPDEQLSDGVGGVSLADDEDEDPMVAEAKRVVIESKKASTSYLQRRLSIGYSRAARIIDHLEEQGIIGPQNGSKPREVYLQAENEEGSEPEDEEEEDILD
ncbi:MAG: DNA translocase FtsK [Candidatus Pacebacteria bacterium]|nr:DNA translocase FtsK [Candidatus Paceibacterota bacterium]